MLSIERRVVQALTTSADPELRAAVEEWVDSTLRVMPGLLRAGVTMESAALSLVARSSGPNELRRLLGLLDRSPVSLLRSYPRLFRSLVLFGELELGPQGAR